MARKSSTKEIESDGPSTADVSANEDVEMQDQEQDSKMSSFKKFGVSAS
jgi:SWI/SNF-related matrix-associated actin-dependent regulator of chromatin subfamily A member 5